MAVDNLGGILGPPMKGAEMQRDIDFGPNLHRDARERSHSQ